MSPKRQSGEGQMQKQVNWRLVIVGGVLIALAVVFYFVMLSIADQSTDPAALMATVGTTAGVVIGVGTAAAIWGYLGKKIG